MIFECFIQISSIHILFHFWVKNSGAYFNNVPVLLGFIPVVLVFCPNFIIFTAQKEAKFTC